METEETLWRAAGHFKRTCTFQQCSTIERSGDDQCTDDAASLGKRDSSTRRLKYLPHLER